jgi:hypothetical protein
MWREDVREDAQHQTANYGMVGSVGKHAALPLSLVPDGDEKFGFLVRRSFTMLYAL